MKTNGEEKETKRAEEEGAENEDKSNNSRLKQNRK
jgi:hypothetical protein